ncbi:unnamed protein product [Penicillium egyptiacum]|uniref:5-methyltetrahydropteroyltriglutamate--homocysteine S-methyltransferase n=1 Tax=Penicillium egyptiacum TaxID=1303716 RepID=A0A9W4KN61_9EURO|nr:unnamed protein product [Penicillium egyptiacum]
MGLSRGLAYPDNQVFKLAANPKPVAHFLEAKEAGIVTRPVVLGPISFLPLGKADRGQTLEPISKLEDLLPLYIDEPVLVFDLALKVKAAFKPAYEKLGSLGAQGPYLTLATYFLDIVHKIDVLPAYIAFTASTSTYWVRTVSSSSLLHAPHTLASEKNLNPEVRDWFSFAVEKLDEVVTIAKAVTNGPAAIAIREQLEANAKSVQARASSKRTNDPAVKARQEAITPEMHTRKSPFPSRITEQTKHIQLPKARSPPRSIRSLSNQRSPRLSRLRRSLILISSSTVSPSVTTLSSTSVSVLLYVFTEKAWVQSYGSRCVRPPIIVGDISRPAPMTVKEPKYAVSISKKPMKGMLTGPITCLRWSFPRDDVHQSVQAQQLALALRDEVIDLEAAGVKVIQVDEPAPREGLPLRVGTEREKYIKWAVKSFRLSTAGVADSTQIHSHFCYSEFQDSFHAIAALDTDVLSIENTKSDAKLLKVFLDPKFPAHIGPGIWDIHSPRVPSKEEMIGRIEEMLQFLSPDQPCHRCQALPPEAAFSTCRLRARGIVLFSDELRL